MFSSLKPPPLKVEQFSVVGEFEIFQKKFLAKAQRTESLEAQKGGADEIGSKFQ